MNSGLGTYPAGQTVPDIDVHIVAPIDDDVPIGQDLQTELPVKEEYFPVSQDVQTEADVASMEEEYFPASQDKQTEDDVEEEYLPVSQDAQKEEIPGVDCPYFPASQG